MDKQEKRFLRMEYLLALGVFLLFAFWVNQGIKMTGLYGDDLYLWYCYHTESLREFLLPLGGTKFRLIHNILCYLQLLFMGPDIWLMVPFNIIVNALIALALFHFVRKIAGCPYLAGSCGLAYLLSHLSYYQITQGYGLMEASALWLALTILYLMYRYLNGLGDRRRIYALSAVLYFIVCLIHERYMVLLAVLLFAVVLRHILTGEREYRLTAMAFAAFAAVMLLRFLTTGTIIPAGTGGTEVTDTFSLQEALGYAVDNVLYVFGVNAGPIHLDGVEWQNVPRLLRLTVYATDGILAVLVVLAAVSGWRQRERRREYACTAALMLFFMAMCIGAASVNRAPGDALGVCDLQRSPAVYGLPVADRQKRRRPTGGPGGFYGGRLLFCSHSAGGTVLPGQLRESVFLERPGGGQLPGGCDLGRVRR